MNSYNSMKWIMTTRNNVVKGQAAHLLKYEDRDRDLCLTHIDPVFGELLEIYG